MKQKRLMSLITCTLCLCVAVVTGCGERTAKVENGVKESENSIGQVKVESDETVEELIIFYDDCKNLLDNFQQTYPEIPIKLYSMSPADLGPEGIEGLIRKQGDPDLILCRGDESIEELIELGTVLPISDLYGEDTAVDPEEYLPGTFDVGRIDGDLYALPVSVNSFYITMRESVWETSDFAALPENFEVEDLLTVMEAELDKHKEEKYQNFYTEMARPLEFLVSSGIVRVEEGSVEMDPELFDRVMRVCCKQMINERALVENGSMWAEFPALNPMAFGGQFLAECWGSKSNVQAAPQVGLVYSNSVNMEVYDEPIRVVFRPSVKAGEYGVGVQTMGLIGANSPRQSEAYDVLRKMMDMPIANWTVPVKTMGDSPTFCPVNIENAKELLACVEASGAEVFAVAASNQEGTNGLSAKKTGVGDELASEFENYVDQITFMYRIDPEVYSESVNDIMLIAMYQGTEQGIVQEAYSDCYDQVMAALQENIDKE